MQSAHVMYCYPHRTHHCTGGSCGPRSSSGVQTHSIREREPAASLPASHPLLPSTDPVKV